MIFVRLNSYEPKILIVDKVISWNRLCSGEAYGKMRGKMAQILAVTLSAFMLTTLFSASFTLYASSDESFGWKFVILGDTQDLAAHSPDLFFNATQWIANQQDIVYVTQMGDLVDSRENLTQWQTAYDAMHVLDGHTDWGVVPGNHDLDPTPVNGTSTGVADATNFNTFFGDCEHYDIVKNRFIFIYTRYEQLDYVETVLQEHPKLYAIIVVHANLCGSMFDVGLHERLAKYDNVVAVLSGHHTGASFLRYFNGQGGIHNLILTNYQDLPSVTNALKVCTVFQDRIEVETFEPMTNTYRNGKYGFIENFSFPYGRDLNAGFLDEKKLFAQTDLANVDMKIADLTSDLGNEVVVAGGKDNIVAVFNSTGSQIASVHQEQPYSLEVIDLNGDGKLEIVCGGKDLIVYDSNLQPLETLLSDRNATRPVMVTVADVNKDDVLELLAVDYDNNSLTRLRVWSGYSKVVDVWVEENLPSTLYEPRTQNFTTLEPTLLQNGTTIYEEVTVEETLTYDDIWPTRPTVVDLNGDGKNEVYVYVPCGLIVSYDDSYAYTGHDSGCGTQICVDEDGDGELEVYGYNNQVLGILGSPFGYFYVGGSPMNMVGYDLDGDGDKEILWTDEGGNICIYDECRMSAVKFGVANATLYAGSLGGDGAADVFAVTDGAIYVYEEFRPAYAKAELQNLNNEYWLMNQPNVISANATLTKVSYQQAAWYSVNTEFVAAVNVTQGETVQIQIDAGTLGKPTGVSASEWTYDEASRTVACDLTCEKQAVTLYWIKTDGKEVSLVLPYLAVAGFTVGWLYMTAVLPKKKNQKIARKTVAFGVLVAVAVILLLLLINFVI